MDVFKPERQCTITFLKAFGHMVYKPIEEGVIMEKVAHPICPLNMYFEGDEDKCNESKCDYDLNTRSCSSGCKIKLKRKNYKFNFQMRMRNACVSIVNRIMDSALRMCYTHKQIVNRLTIELWGSDSYKALSSDYQHYIQGYCDCRITLIEYDHIVWKMYHPDLGLLESKDIPQGDWDKIISEKSNFIWKNTKDNKPYGVTAEERMNENADK